MLLKERAGQVQPYRPASGAPVARADRSRAAAQRVAAERVAERHVEGARVVLVHEEAVVDHAAAVVARLHTLWRARLEAEQARDPVGHDGCGC